MKSHDLVRVKHMIEGGMRPLVLPRLRRGDLNKDRMLTVALMREIEVVGEAASKISEDFKRLHPEIPWALIIGMRNKLIHAYFDINLDILWRTVTVNLPLLKEQLNSILEPSTE
ncbi:MAG: HepT-like ribonuclease domain-containing protein [Pseudomonadota bacterium]